MEAKGPCLLSHHSKETKAITHFRVGLVGCSGLGFFLHADFSIFNRRNRLHYLFAYEKLCNNNNYLNKSDMSKSIHLQLGGKDT